MNLLLLSFIIFRGLLTLKVVIEFTVSQLGFSFPFIHRDVKNPQDALALVRGALARVLVTTALVHGQVKVGPVHDL